MTGQMRSRWIYLGILVALSALGAYVRLGPWSIAFDSMSGFVAALLLGPGPGALVSALGHLAAAGVTGFPLTLPFHLLVALAMAGVGAAGGAVARRHGLGMGVAALILTNGLVAPALLAVLPNPLGVGLFAAMAVPLTAAATANGFAALAISLALKRQGFGS